MNFLLFVIMFFSSNSQSKPFLIAHAGGGIYDQSYSNSLEALDLSYAKGFRYFEIDFSWTSDKQLVCLHDWNKRFKKVFGFKNKKPLSIKKFENLVLQQQGIHPCTLNSFANWATNHPDAKIITDVKYDNLTAIKKIIKEYPDIQQQLIPQFYQPYEYQILKEMGFEDLIWILYQYDGSLKSISKHSKSMELFALSMRASQAKKKAIQKIQKKGVNIFVYTINKEKKMKKMLKAYNVSGIYTDFLPPKILFDPEPN